MWDEKVKRVVGVLESSAAAVPGARCSIEGMEFVNTRNLPAVKVSKGEFIYTAGGQEFNRAQFCAVLSVLPIDGAGFSIASGQ
jgi:hypothetical protein